MSGYCGDPFDRKLGAEKVKCELTAQKHNDLFLEELKNSFLEHGLSLNAAETNIQYVKNVINASTKVKDDDNLVCMKRVDKGSLQLIVF